MDSDKTGNDYGYAHRQERERWRPIVESGAAICSAITCLMPSRWIPPDAEWHLGHTRDGSAWTGPEHATCNVTEGGSRSHQNRPKAARKPRPAKGQRWRPDRMW